ncbi:olfactory receptor 51B6-like [Phyllostomus discolor]|uniref:Olfactory receptor n=1 Tax=Phyllostomus discolor TaxID=89673 RepID=A0A6J2LYP4_9CHIR|nr:olfactory receptor 51B6-like [Phyllostomus discolor]
MLYFFGVPVIQGIPTLSEKAEAIEGEFLKTSTNFPYKKLYSIFKSIMELNTSARPFLLTGFVCLEKAHHWISIPLSAVYTSIVLGNGILIFLIRADHNLHEPMYYFLAMLATTDLGMTLVTMPTVLCVLWMNHREISHGACFLQAYFIHSLSVTESGILLAMSYDRFIAICNPLRYTSILTNTQVIKIGMGVFMRGFGLILPPILPLYWFSYCRSHVLSHAFCLHQDIIKLACADITFNRLYPVVVVFSMVLLDFLIIFCSYIFIFKTVMCIASGENRSKALNTCVSHICCILVFYVTVIGLTFIHRFGKNVPHLVHIIMSYVYFLFPPFMNPVIYSIKTKQIRSSILQLFSPTPSRT